MLNNFGTCALCKALLWILEMGIIPILKSNFGVQSNSKGKALALHAADPGLIISTL